MLIQSAIKATLWLAIGFGLAACATTADPVNPGSQPATNTTLTPTPATVPATNTPLPPAPTSIPATLLPDLGPAPDFTNELWLNTDRPLNLASLEGKVVLVEFWTFG